MLPADAQKLIDVLQKVNGGKLRLKHPKERPISFQDVRHNNLYVNLRANPPEVQEICECKWQMTSGENHALLHVRKLAS